MRSCKIVFSVAIDLDSVVVISLYPFCESDITTSDSSGLNSVMKTPDLSKYLIATLNNSLYLFGNIAL